MSKPTTNSQKQTWLLKKIKTHTNDKIDFKIETKSTNINHQKTMSNKSSITQNLELNITKKIKSYMPSKIESQIETISTNINHQNTMTQNQKLIINKNINKVQVLESIYYYNVGNIKELKKTNKYTSPLVCALHTRKDSEFTIKYDEERNGAKTYIKYGNYDYETLNKVAWKIDNHLYEIVPKESPFKLYFDIDKRFVSEEDTKLIFVSLRDLVLKTLNVDIQQNSNMCMGEGKKDGYKKVSYHIIINNGKYFENMTSCKLFMKYCEFIVNTNDSYANLRNGVFDFNVYKDNQAFKLPYQTKAFKKIKQIPIEDDAKMSDYLLTHMEKSIEFYDVKKFEKLMEGKNISNKTIKSASGKMITLDFSEAIIIKQFVEAIGKDYKIGQVSGSKKECCLTYYLNSIPNNKNVPRIVWKTIGYCISKITKNSEKGLELWTKWTSDYKLVDKESIREEYFKHDIVKGYGWKMLLNMASIYNKKANSFDSVFEPLFDDEPTFECETKTINSRYIECEDFNMVDVVKNNDIVCIKSPMGTGKSWTLKKVFKDKSYKSILYLSCKRAFATAMKSDFEGSGFQSYLDFEYRNEIIDVDRVICSVESAYHLKDAYDLVVIDESESICDNLTGEMIIKNHPIENMTKIKNIISNSKKVMLMDAYLTTRSYNMIKDILKDKIINKKSYYLKNIFKYEKRELVILDGGDKFTNMIINKLEKGERCVVVCGSKKLSDIIVKACSEYSIKNYNSNNPLKNGCNVNEEWSECDLLIYTPTITAGISYDNKDKLFDNLFVYCVNKGSSHFRDTIQAHKRVRNFTNKKMFIKINDKFKGFPYDIMPTTMDGVEEQEYKYKALLFGDNPLSFENMEDLDWIYKINIHNKLEKNISSLMLRGLAKKYLYEENVIEIEDNEEINEENFETDLVDWVYDEIVDITSDTYHTIEAKLKDVSIDKEQLTDDEFKEYVKFNYKNKHISEEVSDEIREKFFNEYYDDSCERKKLASVRSFKQMLNDIKYEYLEFDAWKIEKGKDSEMPMEIYEMKLMRYKHLMRFFNKLGFIENDKLNINKEFYGDDLKLLIEDYKDVDAKVLNSMMKDQYIKISKKDESIKELNTKQIKGIFNNLLKDEFGLEVYGCGTKQKKIDGKYKKLTIMKLRNYCPPIDKKKDSDEIIEKKLQFTKEFGGEEFNRFNIYKKCFNEDLDFDTSYFEDNDLDSEIDVVETISSDEEEDHHENCACAICYAEKITKLNAEKKSKPSEEPKVVGVFDKYLAVKTIDPNNDCEKCAKALNSKCMRCMMKEINSKK
tara:strand:- start:14 stop:3880 length:3867 start_codon:yes stop_codon:yes gene_type:complete